MKEDVLLEVLFVKLNKKSEITSFFIVCVNFTLKMEAGVTIQAITLVMSQNKKLIS